MSYAFRIKMLTPQRWLAVRTTVPRDELPDVLQACLEDVWQYLNRLESATVGPAIVRYHALDDEQIDVEAGFPVAEDLPGDGAIRAAELPAGRAATTLHHGGYDKLPAAYAALQRWMAVQGLRPAGPPWEIYWVDPSQAASVAELRSELVWPVI
jgi:effector-binding domain-containing protein